MYEGLCHDLWISYHFLLFCISFIISQERAGCVLYFTSAYFHGLLWNFPAVYLTNHGYPSLDKGVCLLVKQRIVRDQKPDSTEAGLHLFQQLLWSICMFDIFICFSRQMQGGFVWTTACKSENCIEVSHDQLEAERSVFFWSLYIIAVKWFDRLQTVCGKIRWNWKKDSTKQKIGQHVSLVATPKRARLREEKVTWSFGELY